VENQQKKTKSALFSLLKSLEINPQNEWAIIALGKIVFDQSPNDIQKADSYFKRAVEINLHNINVWRSIITFWHSKNQEQKVDEYCAFALKNNIILEECKY
jgi:tetratricopeptide (TPR) repeat protein